MSQKKSTSALRSVSKVSSPNLDRIHGRISCYKKYSTISSRLSRVQDEFDHLGHRIPQNVKLENTYRMVPEDSETFRPSVARALMQELLETHLEDEKYNEKTCRILSKKLAYLIMEDIKLLDISKRYKYVCSVTIGENRRQGLQISSRCLWDPNTDNSASAVYATNDVYAVAVIYAVYLE